MAFRATTRKPAAKKTSKDTQSADVPVVSVDEEVSNVPPSQAKSDNVAATSAFSVEDLVGSPRASLEDSSKIEAITPAQPTTAPNSQPTNAEPQTRPMTTQPTYGSLNPVNRDRGPRRDFRGGNRGGYGGNRGGGGYRGGGGFDRPYQGNQSDRYNNRDNGYNAPRRDDGYNRGPSPYVASRPVGPDTYQPDVDVPTETVRGVLDTMPEGHGFLRPKYTPSEKDIYISQSQIRRFLLRNGDLVEGQARQPKESERYWGLLKVEKVNELAAELMENRPRFEDLVAVYPNKLLKLETGQSPMSTRIIDLLAPIGFGQRGLLVSPPKAGKTTILKEIAAGISANYPAVHLMAVLIGERPEEVTDISRSVKGEVYASNFDEAPDHQTRVAEVALDRAKRLIEMGHDVVILLDSITRLARAYNLVVNPSGRTLSGGFDPAALYPAKKFLGAARCNEPFITPEEQAKKDKGEEVVLHRVTDGGSLTIIGTALVETGSRMDDLIYEEFKGTGNMELHLSRALQERRVFPAIDAGKSGTRHDELLLGEDTMKKVTTLRHMLSLLSDEERTMMLIDKLGKTKSNDEFLDSLSKGS